MELHVLDGFNKSNISASTMSSSLKYSGVHNGEGHQMIIPELLEFVNKAARGYPGDKKLAPSDKTKVDLEGKQNAFEGLATCYNHQSKYFGEHNKKVIELCEDSSKPNDTFIEEIDIGAFK